MLAGSCPRTRVSRRLVPAYSGNREIIFSRGEGAAFPGGGTRSAGRIAKHGHCASQETGFPSLTNGVFQYSRFW